MLVFGDTERSAAPKKEIARIRAEIEGAARTNRIARHEHIVLAFILSCELAQGIGDLEPEVPGATERAMALLLALADLLLASSDGKAQLPFRPALIALERLAAWRLPAALMCRRQEGFAFYGLYPEAYALAAREAYMFALARQSDRVDSVIGIRSIGVGLAAIVAAATRAPFVTSVRPGGPPFRRETRFRPHVASRLRSATGVVAVVDEGPGLSGSSFLSVVKALTELGVAESRIALFPSHRNPPGPCADEAMRELWNRPARHVAAPDAFLSGVAPGVGGLEQWCADIIGPFRAPPRELTGGAWRSARAGLGDAPLAPMWERRKFLVESERGIFLLRFAGLGPYGQASFARARRLGDAGWTPRARALRHGFLIEEWIDEAAPLDVRGGARRDFLGHLAGYLAFRAGCLPAGPQDGADLHQLLEMLRRNTSLALGRDAPEPAWLERAQALEGKVRRIQTDNRLHAWEWLRTPDGRFVKTDAFDHCADHSLVGCQDLAWDVAGAAVEFDLAGDEIDALVRELAMLGFGVNRELLAFLTPCYLAQQIGLWERAASDTNKDTATRTLYLRYCEKLASYLGVNCFAQELSA